MFDSPQELVGSSLSTISTLGADENVWIPSHTLCVGHPRLRMSHLGRQVCTRAPGRSRTQNRDRLGSELGVELLQHALARPVEAGRSRHHDSERRRDAPTRLGRPRCAASASIHTLHPHLGVILALPDP